MAENSEKTVKRGRGRPFQKGQSGNPGGRPPLPPEAKEWATKDMAALHEISEDETVNIKVRSDIKRWMVEMVYGKAAQAVDMSGEMALKPVVFEGESDIAD